MRSDCTLREIGNGWTRCPSPSVMACETTGPSKYQRCSLAIIANLCLMSFMRMQPASGPIALEHSCANPTNQTIGWSAPAQLAWPSPTHCQVSRMPRSPWLTCASHPAVNGSTPIPSCDSKHRPPSAACRPCLWGATLWTGLASTLVFAGGRCTRAASVLCAGDGPAFFADRARAPHPLQPPRHRARWEPPHHIALAWRRTGGACAAKSIWLRARLREGRVAGAGQDGSGGAQMNVRCAKAVVRGRVITSHGRASCNNVRMMPRLSFSAALVQAVRVHAPGPEHPRRLERARLHAAPRRLARPPLQLRARVARDGAEGGRAAVRPRGAAAAPGVRRHRAL